MKDEATKSRFIQLRAESWSYARIAKALKVSKQTLITWSKGLGQQIANLRAIELEALQEQYFVTKAARIELLGKRLKAINKELDRRGLAKVPTERLLDIQMRYLTLLKEEAVPTAFSEEQDASVELLQKLDKTVVSWSA